MKKISLKKKSDKTKTKKNFSMTRIYYYDDIALFKTFSAAFYVETFIIIYIVPYFIKLLKKKKIICERKKRDRHEF